MVRKLKKSRYSQKQHQQQQQRLQHGKQTTRCCSFRKLGILLIVGLVIYFGLLWSTLATWAAETSSQEKNNKKIDMEMARPRSAQKEKQDTVVKKGKVTDVPPKTHPLSNFETKQQYQLQHQQPEAEAEADTTIPTPKPLSEKERNIIGIASTVTNCGPDPFTEGAAVLKYSIDLTSASAAAKNGGGGGKYDYRFYIMYHPDALECVLPLKDLGFELLERPTPVNVSDIQGDVLRERIVKNGCCGERELIKLEAYRLTQHAVVIHLDLDVLVLQPMDPIIELMLDPSAFHRNNTLASKVPIMWPEKPIPKDIQLLFTKDYNVVAPRRKDKPFQGGFFVIKPSLIAYQLMVNTVLEGDYRDGDSSNRGWGGVVGPFHGGMTIQGLLPWFYENLVPGYAVELNRCVYNNIADNPTTERSVNDEAVGRCRTNEEKCEDCRKRDISEVVVFHYCQCLKPWTCSPQEQNKVTMRLCHKAHHEWFRYRSDLEKSWGRKGIGPSNYKADHFLGYCNSSWSNGYVPIQQPYGKPVPEL